MADQYRIPGNTLSWGSITATVDGEKYYGFTEVVFGDKRTREFVYGMATHQAPRGRTRGKYEPQEGKLKGPKSTVQALLTALASKSVSGRSFGDAEFEVVLNFSESDDTAITVVLESCTVDGVSSSHAEGPEALEDEVIINYRRIRRNDLYLFDARRLP